MLLKKANTITTPTAYSNGFLHSVKPEVVENLLLQSNQFDTTWTEINDIYLTLTSGQSGYDGSSDAWLYEKSAGTYQRLEQDVTLSGVWTFSVYAKAGTISRMDLRNASDGSRAAFNLSNGTLIEQIAIVNTNIESVGNGWYRCSATFNTATTKVQIYIDWANSTAGNIYIQDAQLNKGLTAYPYLETTTEAKPSADFTFTRNSSATRVNELGYIEDVQIIGGELVSNGDFEEIGSELVTYSDFYYGSGGWSLVDGKWSFDDVTYGWLNHPSISVTVGQIYKVVVDVSVPSGVANFRFTSGNAQTILFDYTNFSDGVTTFYTTVSGVNGGIQRLLAPTTLSDAFTLNSISVKEVGQDWTFGGDVTMDDGLVSFVSPTNTYSYIRQNIGSLASSLYRISVEVKNYVSGEVQVGFQGSSPSVIALGVTGNGVYTAEISPNANGDNLEVSRRFEGGAFDFDIDNISVKEVTDDTNLPRINYEGFTYENGLPVPYSGKGHLLLEGQRSNLLPYSEDYLVWTDNSATRISNAAISPSGLQDAYKLQSLVGTSYGTNIGFASSAANHTCSVYAKAAGFDYVKLIWSSGISNDFAVFNLANGSVEGGTYISANIEDAGNGWYRCSMTSILTGGGLHYLWISDGTISRSSSVTGDGTSGIYVWGSMVEVGDYVSSYIPTNGTAVTRLGETCNNATHLFPSEGVLYAEIAALVQSGSDRAISIYYDSSNTISLFYFGTTNTIRALIFNGGTTQASIDFLADDVLDFNKVAIRYKDNDISLWANGSLIGTDTSCTIPTNLASLDFRYAGSNFYGKTKMIATFPYLSNDEMECLTGEGYGTFEALAAAYSYTIK